MGLAAESSRSEVQWRMETRPPCPGCSYPPLANGLEVVWAPAYTDYREESLMHMIAAQFPVETSEDHHCVRPAWR